MAGWVWRIVPFAFLDPPGIHSEYKSDANCLELIHRDGENDECQVSATPSSFVLLPSYAWLRSDSSVSKGGRAWDFVKKSNIKTDGQNVANAAKVEERNIRLGSSRPEN